MRYAHFEFDFDNKYLCAKSSISCENIVPHEKVIEREIYSAIVMFDQYLPGLLDVSNGVMSPKEAVALTEECGSDEDGENNELSDDVNEE